MCFTLSYQKLTYYKIKLMKVNPEMEKCHRLFCHTSDKLCPMLTLLNVQITFTKIVRQINIDKQKIIDVSPGSD